MSDLKDPETTDICHYLPTDGSTGFTGTKLVRITKIHFLFFFFKTRIHVSLFQRMTIFLLNVIPKIHYCKKMKSNLPFVHYLNITVKGFFPHLKVFGLLYLSQFPPHLLLLSPAHLCHSKSQSPSCCPCPWVIYTCSLTRPFPIFTPVSPSLLPSGPCQSVLCFHGCGSISLIC